MQTQDSGSEPTIGVDPGRLRGDRPAPLKRVAPRLPTPGTPVDGGSSTSGSRVPDDVLAEQLQRLCVLCAVAAGLWTVGLTMDAVVFPMVLGMPVSRAGVLISASAVATTLGLYAWVRFSSHAPHVKRDAGLWLMLLNSLDIALIETWATDPTSASVGTISWIAIVILLCAMIMPSTPRKMLVAGLAAASMGPIGVWFAHLRGVDVPSFAITMLMYLPTYSCAVASVVPSQMFQRLGRRLREARDLGSYELQERLGEGGMGEVWRARHRLLARPAAIKLVRPQMLGASDAAETRLALRRFESEAQATAALTSPHTIRVFDFGATDDGRFYYVMELLVGLDMASLVEQSGPLSAPRVLFLLRQVCHSLAEAHSQGLVHRDIKPANIFVCRMGLDFDVVKVLDFGLVQITPKDHGQDLTASLASLDGVVGTPAFMAPETLVGPKAVDHRADLYALGCVAYFLLTGQHVFQGVTPLQSLIDHVSTKPAPPSARTANPVPPWLDELVLECLEKDPDDRPDSAGVILQRIALLESGAKWNAAQSRDWWVAHLPALSASEAVDLRQPV